MVSSNIIHTNNEQKVDPFWWIYYFIVLSVAYLVGIALMIGPLLLFIRFKEAWLLILFILIPVGLWMVKRLYPYTKTLVWHNNHLSSYVLRSETIEAKEWKEAFQEHPSRRMITVSSVRSVVASSYIVRQTRSLRSQGGTGNTITETAPILYVIYEKDDQQHLLTVPFSDENDGINAWLGFFQDRSIPLKYTANVLHRTDMTFANDEQRLEHLKSTDDSIGFSFSGEWQVQGPQLWEEWMSLK